MLTLVEVLQRLDGVPGRITLEEYIARTWVRPLKKHEEWHFEEIDIARIRLVHHLQQELMVGHEAMDIVLHLMDQLYELREHMRKVAYAARQLPHPVQTELWSLLREMNYEYTDV